MWRRMGAGASVDQQLDQEASRRNKLIDSQLMKDKISEAKIVHLLLLGAGESGKSTFAKQMKIIHEKGFTEKERMTYKHLIHSNAIQGCVDLINGMKQLAIDLQDEHNKKNVETVLKYHSLVDRGEMELNAEIASAILQLWRDKGVQETLMRAREFQLPDSTEYYNAAVERLSAPGYVPSEQDVLRCRLQTTGVVETVFHFKGYKFRMYDVGGQRSERRKWIHCFDNVTAIIFTAALSAYDQVLREDITMNRMHESLTVFTSICNHNVFRSTSMILFLNKKDIFEAKILTSPLNSCFPEYTGPNEYTEASTFIRRKFEGQNRVDKEIYTHFTNATDTKNINFVFDASMAVVLRKNLEEAGMF